MFNTTGERRRRFINFVNRNLERALAVNTPSEGRVEIEQQNPLFEDEEIIIIEDEQQKERRIARLITILAAIPKGIARRLIPRAQIDQLRNALGGLRLDQLPAAIIEQLNEIL